MQSMIPVVVNAVVDIGVGTVGIVVLGKLALSILRTQEEIRSIELGVFRSLTNMQYDTTYRHTANGKGEYHKEEGDT